MPTAPSALGFFERYLSLWVFLCIIAGTLLGLVAPAATQAIGALEIAQVNIPVGLLIWVMIIPMLMKIDFSALHEVYEQRAGMAVTLTINWLIKPFTMAFFAWLFLRHVFADWLPAEQLDSYVAADFARRGALHGDGVCLEQPVPGQRQLHPEPSGDQ